MKAIGCIQYFYQVDYNLEINLSYKRFKAYSTISKDNKENIRFLVIEATFDLEEYDSLTEGAAKLRPQLLVLMGVFTFFTREVLIPANSSSSHMTIVKKHSEPSDKMIFKCNDCDYSEEARSVLQQIEDADPQKQILIFSLLERWRKALYLLKHSEEGNYYSDEAILSFMHTLEVLSDEYSRELKKAKKIKRKQLLIELIEAAQKQNGTCDKSILKIANELSVTHLTLREKIIRMLSDLELNEPKTMSIVARYIDHRNSIAHGRKDIYSDRAIYPLQPFFSLVKDVDEDAEIIMALSAVAISRYLGIKTWDEEWEQILEFEYCPVDQVKEFIVSGMYLNISINDFISGAYNNIYPFTISHYYKKGHITFEELEKSLRGVVMNSEPSEENGSNLFDLAAILADSHDQTLADACKGLVRTIHSNDWGYYSHPRDVLKNFEYHGRPLNWYGQWLSDRHSS